MIPNFGTSGYSIVFRAFWCANAPVPFIASLICLPKSYCFAISNVVVIEFVDTNAHTEERTN